jgi:hypothetical protein
MAIKFFPAPPQYDILQSHSTRFGVGKKRTVLPPDDIRGYPDQTPFGVRLQCTKPGRAQYNLMHKIEKNDFVQETFGIVCKIKGLP